MLPEFIYYILLGGDNSYDSKPELNDYGEVMLVQLPGLELVLE